MIKPLFFVFAFAALQCVEATVKFVFERREVSNSTRRLEEGTEVDTHEKCPPGQYVKAEKAFKQALKILEPELPDSEIDSWANPRIAEIEGIDDEVCHHGKALKMTLRWLHNVDWTALFKSIDWNNIDWNSFDWGQSTLTNGVSTSSMKCIHDEAETQRDRELTVSTPEEDKQDERHLQYCPGWCYSVACAICFGECWGCFRRRQLTEAEVAMELAKVQEATDAMYNYCLADDIGCMDCSSAKLCTDAAVDPNGDPICVGPSCLENGTCEKSLT